jgi:hypothetical protein
MMPPHVREACDRLNSYIYKDGSSENDQVTLLLYIAVMLDKVGDQLLPHDTAGTGMALT